MSLSRRGFLFGTAAAVAASAVGVRIVGSPFTIDHLRAAKRFLEANDIGPYFVMSRPGCSQWETISAPHWVPLADLELGEYRGVTIRDES